MKRIMSVCMRLVFGAELIKVVGVGHCNVVHLFTDNISVRVEYAHQLNSTLFKVHVRGHRFSEISRTDKNSSVILVNAENFSDFVMQSVFIALSGDDDDESTFWEKLNLWELGAATVGGGLYGSTIAFVAFDLMNIEDVGRRIANWAFDAEMPGRRPAAVAASLPSVSILLNTGTHTAKAVSMLGDEEVEGKDAFVEFCKSFGGAKSIMRLVDKITEDSEEE